ncbi:glycosyl family 43 [Pelomyxa schiedti]|nr:glycosyl family 43 [Pelomyxa schiedti]
MERRVVVCVGVVALVVMAASAKLVTVRNDAPFYDDAGSIIDSHDGSVQQFEAGGLFYMHTMQYGDCLEPLKYGCDSAPDGCGFHRDHNISVWVSSDLTSGSWHFEGHAIEPDQRPPGVVFRPHLVYNPNTFKYVLWWNWYDADSGSDAPHLLAVATSDSPSGPFTLQNEAVNTTRASQSGDFALFVDLDGTGYVTYSWDYVISIEQLTPDFIYTTGKTSSIFSEYFVEAPVMFGRATGSTYYYYVLFGWCCCFCMQGSGIMVHKAESPLGPYVTQSGDIACTESTLDAGAFPTPGQGCQYADPESTSVTKSQQNYVFPVSTLTGVEYIWTGDRWQQSPDGLKSHDPQYWVPLEFTSSGDILPVSWIDSFTLDLP